MKKNIRLKILAFKAFALIFMLSGCFNNNTQFIGFWEGPHPEDRTRNFYIQIKTAYDSITAQGFWAQNKFYLAKFKVDQVIVMNDSISFRIPGWKCNYSGRLVNKKRIEGGFECIDEPFDKVGLTLNNEIENYLIYPKIDSKSQLFNYKYQMPELLNDGIKVSTFNSNQDSLFIYSIVPEIINSTYGRINSFLLYKNNRLICEEYFFNYSNSDLHQVESCTKSITSLLIGIATDKGLINNLNEPLYKIFSEEKDTYMGVSVSHLLTMTSGFDPSDLIFSSENRIDFALNQEIIHKPGSVFQYDGGNTEILGAILKLKTGLYADEFAKKYLFEPLQIKKYNWEIYKQDGYPNMSGSLQLLPRDMVKIGGLVLNKGTFNKQKVVSENWINESTSFKTKTHIVGDNYSYHWWNLNLKSGLKNYKTIWANGWGSQFIFVFPELNTVIVTTGHNYEGDSWAITKGITKYLHLLNN